MRSYEQTVFNRFMDWALDRRSIHLERVRTLEPARGAILEVGTGTGLNFSTYPSTVRAVTCVTLEPDLDRRARHRAKTHGIATIHVCGNAERLPFADASFDTIVSTFLLCSVRDPATAVREFARVLRPDGELLFLEHVISRHAITRGLQRLVEPVYVRVACGCSLTRDTAATIAANGFAVQELVGHELGGMAWIARSVIRGRARPRARASHRLFLETSHV